MNRVNLLGRIATDIELRQTQKGMAVTSFRLAVRKDKETTYFFDVTAFGHSAEAIHTYLGKGRQIALDGHLTVEEWNDKSGQHRSRVVVILDSFDFCGDRESAPAPAPVGDDDFSVIDDNEDLPF